MSNVKTENLHYPADFIKKESKQIEKKVKDEYETNSCTLNCVESSNPFHKENDHSCFYNSSASAPKTILITNNYSQDDPIGLKNHQNIQKSSSITIVTHNADGDHSTNNMPTSASSSTVVLDRINICINNHFNDPRASVPKSSSLVSSEKTYPDEPVKEKTPTEPDSTTSNVSSPCEIKSLKLDESIPSYSNGQDVLVQRKDGRFYLGTIIAIARNQCLVKFDDNTEYWSLFDEITKLSSIDTNNDPMCVVCKKVNISDVVEVCERCGRGYHQKCAEGSFQKNGIWFCRRCTARNGFKLKHNECKSIEDKQTQAPRIEPSFKTILHKSQLPYDIDSLSWDSHHRVNLEQIYCYCGGNGEWHNKMLQCCKCEQWFHENCVRCLDYPIYRGDRFFVFACSMCNHGTEFLRRLVMKWIDIVHLLLFNITTYNQKKYYHVNKVIVPYAIDNWPMLQLHQSMRSLTAKEIKDKIFSTLSSNSPRFKCGREIKKRQSVWGLRTRIPPPAPIVAAPWEIEINEQYLRQRAKLNFLPLRSSMAIPKDVEVKMSGAEYLGENSDNESTGGISDAKFTSDDELPLKLSIEKEKKKVEVINAMPIDCISSFPKSSDEKIFPSSSESSEKSRDSADCSAGGADVETKDRENLEDNEIKKLDTFDVVTNIKRNRKRKSPFLSSSTTTAATDNIMKHAADIIDICDSSDDTSSRGTLDLIIPPPKNFQGRNNPFRLTPKKNENNNIEKMKLLNKNNTGSSSSSGSSNRNLTAVKQSILNSKLFGNVDLSQAAGQFRIVRTVKRRLSAKDIMIGPNKEVKRRRLRRRSGNVEVISTSTIQTLPKSAAYLPIRSDSKDWPVAAIRSTLTSASSSSSSTPQATTPTNLGAISNVFNGRRLRQRQEKNYAESSRRNSNSSLTATCSTVPGNISIPCSPNKVSSQSDVSLFELKTSVNMYFGAANRIENGENFVVRAKRLAPNGKVQYLIEWEGLS